jgi:hypothetical protein
MMNSVHFMLPNNKKSAIGNIAAIFLIILSSWKVFACNDRGKLLNTSGAKNMTFKFEDYDVKSPEIVQKKLAELFPQGSSLSEFKNLMEQSGAVCESYKSMYYCRHQSGRNPFVKSKWIVGVKIGEDNTIGELTVKAGFVGT